jgi:hypothetical protein
MDFEATKKQIEEIYSKIANTAKQLDDELSELRSIDFSGVDTANTDDIKIAMELGRDIDMRTKYVLRLLLVHHGNVLFL